MIDKDWLKEAINEQAKTEFWRKYETLPPQLNEDSDIRVSFKALLNTEEFKDFKKAVLPFLKEQRTQEILQQLEGVKELLGGEE